MPHISEISAEPTDQPTADAYNSIAAAYAAESETGLFNAFYTHPAILDLAGDVAGRQILDVGCGAGPIAVKLRDRGATVTGFDSSAEMLELARKRLGPDTDLRVADLNSPLPYPDGAFDDVIAALVLHYLEDWTGPLAELRRVLKPGGRLIAAVDHPFAMELLYRQQTNKPAYFQTRSRTEEWTYGGSSAQLTFWTRPLHAMADAFTKANFKITRISEPPPAADTPRELLPDLQAENNPTGSFLGFLFFTLEAS
jgi:ubiquinone/menaquinone biosynthesis C-methylase UbiE